MIRLELTEQERGVLAEAIESHISDLRLEISDTNIMDYREMLKANIEILRNIVEHLEDGEQVMVSAHPMRNDA